MATAGGERLSSVSSPAGEGRRRGRAAVGRKRDRRVEEARRCRARRVGAASRARPRLQAGRTLERLHRGDEGSASRRPTGRRRTTRSRCCFEMIEVYRDRLKLDVMVVNAFNQILTIQPTNFEAVDALAAQYEAMKRWPDLDLAAAQEGVGRRDGRGEGRAAPAGREPVPREVLEPGRGDQGLRERSSSSIPTTARRIGFLKQMYEKRRDWEKLVAVNQREIDKLTDADERKAPAHRGGQARLGEAEEAGRSRSSCGRRCSRTTPRTSRRSASSRSSTSARRPGASSATVLRAAGRSRPATPTQEVGDAA